MCCELEAAACLAGSNPFGRRDKLEPRHLNLNEVLSGLVKLLRRLIGEHVTLSVVPAQGLKAVQADPRRLEQVLMNLCVNARDAMPGGGQITIRTSDARLEPDFCLSHPWGKPGDFVLCSVSDTGTGISKELQEHIFEPFFTTKGVGRGTGLGLARVYGIVKQHGGLIHFDSETGKGTTFHIYLPAVDAPMKDSAVTVAHEPAPGGRETILIAEDEEQVRELATRILRQAGYHVMVARDGEEAISEFEQKLDDIDLALLDVVMPRKSGYAVWQVIGRKRPDLPVVFSTGYGGEYLELPQDQGEELHLLYKPYGPDELLRKVHEMLAPRR